MSKLIVIIIPLWITKNRKMSSFVEFLSINAVELKNPTLSEANRANSANEFTKKICLEGNHKLANLFAELSIKQKPKDVIKVPKRKK